MPPTDDKGRFVAIKLGLWHEGPNIINKEGLRGAGAPPPPDFLSPAGEDLLLRTVLNRRLRIEFDGDECYIRTRDGTDSKHGSGRTPAEALLDAAFKALEEK